MPTNKDFSPEILDKLSALQKKYAAMGQDISSYLDGLLYADFLTYWDYINLDTLLNLQQPITPYPDERVFRGNLKELLAYCEASPFKGEFILLVDNRVSGLLSSKGGKGSKTRST